MRERSPAPVASPPPSVRRLLDRAYLFDDPGAYEAGVLDAFEALVRSEVEEAAA